MEDSACTERLSRPCVSGRVLAMVLFVLAAPLLVRPAHAVDPSTQEILDRLGTSVEARILTLSTHDMPESAFEMDMVIGVAKYINANMIFVEVLNDDGYMNYPSKVWPHREGENDRLQMLIDRAHAQGIQVVPWIKTFFAAANGQLGPVLEQRPEWAAVGSDGNILTSYGLAWFNPAHPEPRKFIQRAILELVTDYDIDGLQLDYIRYPNTYPEHIPTVYSYDDYSRRAFQKATGLDPIDLPTPTFPQLTGAGVTLESLPPEWQSWTIWRENQIHSFLDELTQQVRAVRPDLPLFFGVIPALWSGTTYPYARFLLNQHWTAWIEAGYVDGLTPPSYTEEDVVLIREVSNIRDLARTTEADGPVVIYPSLMVYPDPNTLVRQIELLRQMGIPGFRLFTYGRMSLQHLQALHEGPFAEPALVPHDKPFMSALRLVEELQEVLYALGGESNGLHFETLEPLLMAVQPLRERLESVAGAYREPAGMYDVRRKTGISREAAEEMLELVATLAETTRRLFDSPADEAVRDGVLRSLRYVQSLIEYGMMVEMRP